LRRDFRIALGETGLTPEVLRPRRDSRNAVDLPPDLVSAGRTIIGIVPIVRVTPLKINLGLRRIIQPRIIEAMRALWLIAQHHRNTRNPKSTAPVTPKRYVKAIDNTRDDRRPPRAP